MTASLRDEPTAAPGPFLSRADRPWREPTQERSRERVERIMVAAHELLAEGGLGNLKVSAIAKRAQVPVGTFYQFFPHKQAVVGRILFDQMEASLQEIYARCNPGRPLTAPAADATALIEPRFKAWSQDPAMVEIWSIVQADRGLRHICVESSEAVADITFEALRPHLRPDVPPDRLRRICFMIADLFDAAMRTALELDRAEAARYMSEYGTMVRDHLAGLLVSRPRDGDYPD